MADYLRRIVKFPGVLEHLRTWATRTSPHGVYLDACDGSILRGEDCTAFDTPEKRKTCIPFSMCTDATTIGANTKPISMTPVVCLCLALPEHLREKFTLMYLAACFPKRAKDPVFLEPIADMFKRYGPGGESIEVAPGVEFHVVKAWRVDDLGGIAGGINAKQHGAYAGACIQCEIAGVRCVKINGSGSGSNKGTMYYPGAVTYLPFNTTEGKRIRDKFKAEYTEIRIREIAWRSAPEMMTAEKAFESADRVASGNLSRREIQMEPYYGFNVWTKKLDYFDVVNASINDQFHELSNTIRDTFNIMRSNNLSSGGMHFSDKRRSWENAIGRFKGPFFVIIISYYIVVMPLLYLYKYST